MKLLSFHYHLKFTMDEPVSSHRFTLRCVPQSDARQTILQLQKYVFPADFLSESRDCWGNALLYGSCREAHTCFEASICGQTAVGLANATPSRNPVRDSLFRYATPLTAADASLSEFARSIRLPDADTFTQAQHVMEAVHSHLSYVSGSTTVQTTAAQAFDAGRGVCQDYSHVMLAVLRAMGIPCRYVAGMLLGEGESHAWVEVLCDGQWYAFDPTACQQAADEHIKLSHGRDSVDCAINRGVFRGSASQKADISVIVTKVN